MQLAIEGFDRPLQVLVAGHERVHELVLFDRFGLVAEGEVRVGEEARGDDVARIELHGPVQRLDGTAFVLQLAQGAAEAHPRGEIRRIDGQAGTEDLLRFRGLSGPAQLFGELVEETALRIRLQTEPQLFDFRIRRRLRHSRT
jgi:hypothetical protein